MKNTKKNPRIHNFQPENEEYVNNSNNNRENENSPKGYVNRMLQ